MSSGNSHIQDPRDRSRALCGAPYRKPIHHRPQTCPQCARVEKRKGGAK